MGWPVKRLACFCFGGIIAKQKTILAYNMIKSILKIALLLIALSPCFAHASNWYYLNKVHPDVRVQAYFFDMDTVEKNGDTVTIWIKYIREEVEKDGSYSTASRDVYFCKNRNTKSLTFSMYGNNGNFIKSISGSSEPNYINPDSIGEALFKTICAKDFPNKKGNNLYSKVYENDIFKAASNYFFELKNPKDPAPK